jgi:hypothetical protein
MYSSYLTQTKRKDECKINNSTLYTIFSNRVKIKTMAPQPVKKGYTYSLIQLKKTTVDTINTK